MTVSNARPARVHKAIRKPGEGRKTKASHGPHDHATVIFRDFVRQLEKLDGRKTRPLPEGSR